VVEGELTLKVRRLIDNELVRCMPHVERVLIPRAAHPLEMVNPKDFNAAVLQFLAKQSGFGIVFGLVGFALLWLLSRIKKEHDTHFGADQVHFLVTPIVAFVGATAFGGSGFLAAFVAGLLFETEEHMVEIERFFFQVVDGVAKPVIFVLLGALVDLHHLIAYAPVGIAAALIFMFV
jgi:NhaP-type Na+/H+ or K+/H+ antiporter